MDLFDPTRLAAFLVAGIALNVTPGPDVMYVLARSVGQGRRAGVVSSLGIGGGTLFHIAFAAFGLSALLSASAVAFTVVKLAGAAYLLWMGVQMLRARDGGLGEVAALAPVRLSLIFRDGVVTNVLNPKVALFFVAFLPQFVDPTRGSTTVQLVVLGLLFNCTGTAWNCFLALAAGGVGEWLKRHPRAAVAQRKLTGGVFVALGARLAFQGRA